MLDTANSVGLSWTREGGICTETGDAIVRCQTSAVCRRLDSGGGRATVGKSGMVCNGQARVVRCGGEGRRGEGGGAGKAGGKGCNGK